MSSLYYPDFEVGQVFTSHARTMTETDLTMFSMLTGDWNPVHNDSEFASKTKYGERLIHGSFGIGLALGLLHGLGIFEDSAVAMLGVKDWQFKKPMFIGDTLHLRLTILEKEMGKSGNTGRLGRLFELVDKDGEVVHSGQSDVLVRVHPVA